MSNEKINRAFEILEKGIDNFWTSDKYIQYLQVVSKFHRYSLNNQILIAMQYPDATYVAGYKAWQKFERHVNRGEKGITIIAPVKKTENVEVADADGNKSVEQREVIRFMTATVFDVSQTSGKEIPSIATPLMGNVNRYDEVMGILKQISPFPISFGETGTANGYCSHAEGKIVIKEGMSQAQTLKTTIHELAHAILHADREATSRKEKEVQAESVAYIVSNHFGLDTSDYSFGYVAAWAGRQDKEVLTDSMKIISSTSKDIIVKLEDKLQKEKQDITYISFEKEEQKDKGTQLRKTAELELER